MVTIDLSAAPESPGCYLFKDSSGEVLYVGKAGNIRARLSSYRLADEPRKARMLERASEVSFILTMSEKEALIVEAGLIRRLKPRYNVRLTDDKRYPYIQLSDHEYPRVRLTRNPAARGHTFGPFPDAGAAKLAVKVVREAFKIRDCKELLPGGCLNFQMNLCWAPCIKDPAARVRAVGDSVLGRADPDVEYARATEETVRFLRGDASRLVRELTREMDDTSGAQEFERAAKLRDRLRGIQATLERQAVFRHGVEDRDAFEVATDARRAVGVVVLIRDGEIAGQEHFVFRRAAGDRAELLEEFVRRYYEHLPAIPREVLIPMEITGAAALEEYLSERAGHRVVLRVPQRGDLVRTLDLARRNAAFRLESERSRRGEADQVAALAELAERLGLATSPGRIECFDVSHLSGTEVVASMSVLVDAEPATDQYRHFKIGLDRNDDFAAMEEVVRRRYSRLADEKGSPPDLVLIDGGRGQLAAARKGLAAAGFPDLAVAALAKRDEEVFLPHRMHAIPFDGRSPGLLVLMHARDEAHRFALRYQRRRRAAAAKRSLLDAIPGVGDSRKRALLAYFGSADAVLRASADDLCRVPGVGASLAARIREHAGAESHVAAFPSAPSGATTPLRNGGE